MSQEQKYDVVLDVLQKHRDKLWDMTKGNSEWGIMDQIRLRQMEELQDAMDIWVKYKPKDEEMNERIAELMIEAGKTIPGDKHIDADFCNKFAELIVQECADFLMDTMDDHFAAEQLIEHFGVDNG